MLGLFKSASQRAAESVQVHVNSLRGLDQDGLAALALYCSFSRLANLDIISKRPELGPLEKYEALFYQPFLVDLPFVQKAIGEAERRAAGFDRKKRFLAQNPFDKGFFGLLSGAEQTWRNTWLGCLHAEVRYLCKEMWGLIEEGFPLVDKFLQSLLNDPQFSPSDREIYLLKCATSAEVNEPDYKLIPEGFEK